MDKQYQSLVWHNFDDYCFGFSHFHGAQMFFKKRGGSMWSSVNPWSADTQEARMHICVLDMLAAGLACKLSSLFELYLYSLLVWQSL